ASGRAQSPRPQIERRENDGVPYGRAGKRTMSCRWRTEAANAGSRTIGCYAARATSASPSSGEAGARDPPRHAPHLLLIQLLDLARPVLLHRPPLHLHRRREPARFDAELARQQPDLRDSLVLRQLAIERVHDFLIERKNICAPDQRFAR